MVNQSLDKDVFNLGLKAFFNLVVNIENFEKELNRLSF